MQSAIPRLNFLSEIAKQKGKTRVSSGGFMQRQEIEVANCCGGGSRHPKCCRLRFWSTASPCCCWRRLPWAPGHWWLLLGPPAAGVGSTGLSLHWLVARAARCCAAWCSEAALPLGQQDPAWLLLKLQRKSHWCSRADLMPFQKLMLW